ncbi:uncharacterized protein HD556DRAFT_1370351 [Suillus plorans]|uniref:non-specific serine/threonine protein kinase n=1 Tax=Suillus plorans TaxID=116603 RepID=A0A9P7DIN0_9AGAM|nr:uncharacterized protein HD556DRAFT_1370351 [Suillus plorans]KAG1794435.1 hypothetical protein HD556DRAFT_1370351 [Suillus plorans]
MTTSARVNFYAVLAMGNELCFISVSANSRIAHIFEYIKSRYLETHPVLKRISYKQCKFYKFKNPVIILDDVLDDIDIVQQCLDEQNWIEVLPDRSLKVLGSELRNDHVYLVIKPPQLEEEAIENVLKRDEELFRHLQVTVAKLQSWTARDVEHNLDGGTWLTDSQERPDSIADIEDRLARARTYAVPNNDPPSYADSPRLLSGSNRSITPITPARFIPLPDATRDLENASSYKALFDNIFLPAVPTEDHPVDVKDTREFAAFFSVLRSYHQDCALLVNDSSSSQKASNFTVHFISPPFFSHRSGHFKYKEQTPWEFPIFLNTRDNRNAWCKFSPASDCMVSSTSFLCPFMICQVVSQRSESDRFRMLVQGIALARVGQCFMPSGEKFFVVAIYLRENLTAERYIVTQPGADRKVFIVQKNFDLTMANEAVAFLREMYNLAQELDSLAGKIDPKNTTRLADIKVAAFELISLTSQAQHNTTPRTTLASVFEENREASGVQDDLGVFDADDIQGILKRMDCQILFIVFGHPFLAFVSNIEDDSQQGYLKFVKEGQKEIEILRYLTGIESPSNHTISPVQIWSVQGGNVISMPMAGSHLTSLSNAGAHLWPVAEQLFEAVDFMHQHGVAHLDLKPPNILLPADGGRLSIIDFNRYVRVKGTETMFRGIVGTIGYLAPEVAAGQGLYSAIRADLWSCGKTLDELCYMCSPSRDRNALLEIARELMNEDPRQRPMMSDVLKRLAYYKVDANTGPGYFSLSSVAPPV